MLECLPDDASLTLPDGVSALIEAAQNSGDADQLDAVFAAAVAAFPQFQCSVESFSSTSEAEITDSKKTDANEASSDAQLDSKWTGEVSAHAAFASGNTATTTVGAVLDATKKLGTVAHRITGFADFAKASGAQTQRRWGAAYQIDSKIDGGIFGYWRVAYEDDAFSGFDYRLFTGAGFGRHFAQSDNLNFKAEVGPGFRYSSILDKDESNSDWAAYTATELDIKLAENVQFEQDTNLTWTEPTTTVFSVSSISTSLTETLDAGVSFQYRYETAPPADRLNQDKLLRATISYGF